MTLTPTRLCLVALLAPLALLALIVPARADYVPWSYTWSTNPGSVSADGGAGSIHMLPASGNEINGMQNVLAAQLQTIASNPAAAKANFSNGGYTMTITLLDKASGQSGSLTFGGKLSGYFTPTAANITNQFTGPVSQQLTLGKDSYTVVLGSYLPPGGPSSGTFGRIGADVLVSGPGTVPPTQAPEPGSLALAALGVSALGARLWWQRRQRTRSRGAQAQHC